MERLFLHKVGGGYIFLHRSLLEYFSGAQDENERAVKSRTSLVRSRSTVGILAAAAFLTMLRVYNQISLKRAEQDAALRARIESYPFAVQTLDSSKPKTAENGTAQDTAPLPAKAPSTSQIHHLVVIMLEQQSFDRILGDLKSVDPRVDGLTGQETNRDNAANLVESRPLAKFRGLNPNPDSSFEATDLQIFGGEADSGRQANMQGFVKSYLTRPQPVDHSRNVMAYFKTDEVPVLATLAMEFAVCDHWFSSVPGPSVPNHAFADFGTSFGRVNLNVVYFELPQRTIYERLLENGQTAKIYQYNQKSWYLPHLVLTKQYPELFGTLQQFLTDTRAGNLPEYSFVEPNYSERNDFEAPEGALDQHGPSQLSADDFLVAQVYNVLRNNDSMWRSSILLITYSNHGGFYDHVAPPLVPPDQYVAPPEETKTGEWFRFDRLGVRVSAIVVSPYIPRGTVDYTVYEHASIPNTAVKLFLGKYSGFRSRREIYAATFDELLTLKEPRSNTDTPTFEAIP